MQFSKRFLCFVTPVLLTSQSLALTQRPLYAVLDLTVKGGTETNLSHLKEFHSLRNEISSVAILGCR